MKKNIALETIYNNLNLLIKDFKDLPETDESENNFWKFVKQNMLAESDIALENTLEDVLYSVSFFNQKQGFIYGFQYAVELLAK